MKGILTHVWSGLKTSSNALTTTGPAKAGSHTTLGSVGSGAGEQLLEVGKREDYWIGAVVFITGMPLWPTGSPAGSREQGNNYTSSPVSTL